VARSTLREVPARRGPKPTLSDELLLEEIRTVLEDSPFYSEGHRKVRAHLRKKGFRVGKNRVLRVCAGEPIYNRRLQLPVSEASSTAPT